MLTKKLRAMSPEPVAYDYSESAHDPRLRCPECDDELAAPALYAGEEWGGPIPDCEICGATITGLVEVDS